MANSTSIDQPAEKSATNPKSWTERIKKGCEVFGALAVVAGLGWGLSQANWVAPRDREIASLKDQVKEKEQKISQLEAARDPDRKQINELLATNQKLENNLAGVQDSLKQSRDDNAKLEKRINVYKTNGDIFTRIDVLVKRKSEIAKEDYRRRDTTSFDNSPPKPATSNQAEEQRQRQSDDYLAQILSLQQTLKCEPK